jgi:hypothetical protein
VVAVIPCPGGEDLARCIGTHGDRLEEPVTPHSDYPKVRSTCNRLCPTMRVYPFWGKLRHEGRGMDTNDEFLWGGLRTRLERTGQTRPRTIRPEAVGQLPDRVHPQVLFHPVRPALGQHLRAAAQAERVG